MNKTGRQAVLWVLLGTTTWLSACWADETISVEKPWVREAPPHAETSAAYLTIQNNSAQEQTLLDISSPQFQKAEIHSTQLADGQVRMQQQDKVTIAPHGDLEFKPGAYHLMLIHPLHPLKEGDMVELRLQFNEVPRLTVQAPIRKSEETKDSHQGHGMQDMQDMKM